MAAKRETALELWGKELAHARERAGMTARQLAEALNVVPSTVSQWESGKRRPHLEDLKRIEELLGTDDYLLRLRTKWVSREIPTEWTDKWVAAEARATLIQGYELAVIPGLLQTEDYARAVLKFNRRASIDLEERVRSRLDRQAILDDGNPPTCVFVIDEYALRRPEGGPTVMAEQLKRLRALAERPEIIVQIVPLGTEYYPAYPFMIAKFDGTEIANIDDALKGQIVEGRDEIYEISIIWEDIRRAALSPKESLTLIDKVIEEWTP